MILGLDISKDTSLDNTLDEVEYIFQSGNDSASYMAELDNVKQYIMNIYENDKERKTIEDFPSFEEYEKYYQEKYPWIYPNQGSLGLSRDMAVFKASYYSLLNLMSSCQLSSGCRSVFLGLQDDNSNIVMFIDSRMGFTKPAEEDPYYHVPGSFYEIKDTDHITNYRDEERHHGYYLGGYETRFVNIYLKTDPDNPLIFYEATVFIEYDLEAVKSESINILIKELIVLGISSVTLVALYALFSYLLFVRNINKLSKASDIVREKLVNKNMDAVVEANVRSNDEIKALSDSFTAMETEIINYVNIIRQETLEKEKINAELSVASKIQLDALPNDKFEDKKLLVRAYIKTAKEVGGDFYDYFYLDDHRMMFFIADVSGKGIPASLFMMKGKELIRSALISSKSLVEAIKHANDLLARNNKELLFITSFIGVIDFNKHEVRYVNAGQEKPYIVSNGKVIKLEGEANIVLGVEEGYEFVPGVHPFNEGDYIFMFTDGLNESINSNNEEFGYSRIEENLLKSSGAHLDNVIKSLNDSLDEFVACNEQFDDVTMLLIKLKDYKLSLHYEEKDYRIITDIVDKFNEAYPELSEGVKASTGIIIDELVNNLISYEKREDLVIDVSFELTKKGLEITISCNGEDYNPFTNHKEKYLQEYHSEIQEGGFGLSIIKDLAKSYSYEYKDGHSIIHIVIK